LIHAPPAGTSKRLIEEARPSRADLARQAFDSSTGWKNLPVLVAAQKPYVLAKGDVK
jgi:hypothetical protein